MDSFLTGLSVIIFILIIGCIYFVPSFVAYANKKENAGAITILNVFLGWTLIGWVVALVWACCKDRK